MKGLNKEVVVVNGLDFKMQLKLFDVVVCHGGSGIVQHCVSLRIPIVVIAHFCDQPYWGQLVQQLRIG